MRNYRKSELLKEVKRRLKDRINTHRTGICSILKEMINDHKYVNVHYKLYDLRDWVMSLLGDESYYNEWLRYKVSASKFKCLTGYEIGDYRALYDQSIAHKGRLQWLDWMIEIHKEAEDIADGKTPKTHHIKNQSSNAILEMVKRYKVKK